MPNFTDVSVHFMPLFYEDISNTPTFADVPVCFMPLFYGDLSNTPTFADVVPAGNRISKRNQKDTGYDIQNSCLFEIRNDSMC